MTITAGNEIDLFTNPDEVVEAVPTDIESPVELFNFNGSGIRVTVVEGEPWFVATDVTSVLGFRNGPKAVRDHVLPAQKGSERIVHPLGGAQDMTLVNEPGLYRLIMRSRVAGAAAFQDWVTADVLPSIRKTGGYQVPVLSGKELLAAALVEAQATIEARELTIAEQRQALVLVAPKGDFYDKFVDASGTQSVGAVAKILGLGQNELFDQLRLAGVFIPRGHMYNTPYAQYAHHFEVNPTVVKHNDGSEHISRTTRVKASGVPFIAKKLGLSL